MDMGMGMVWYMGGPNGATETEEMGWGTVRNRTTHDDGNNNKYEYLCRYVFLSPSLSLCVCFLLTRLERCLLLLCCLLCCLLSRLLRLLRGALSGILREFTGCGWSGVQCRLLVRCWCRHGVDVVRCDAMIDTVRGAEERRGTTVEESRVELPLTARLTQTDEKGEGEGITTNTHKTGCMGIIQLAILFCMYWFV